MQKKTQDIVLCFFSTSKFDALLVLPALDPADV